MLVYQRVVRIHGKQLRHVEPPSPRISQVFSQQTIQCRSDDKGPGPRNHGFAAVQDLPDAVEKHPIHRVFGEAASISRESSKKRMWIWIKPKKKTPVDLSFPGLILTEIYRKDGSKQPDKVHQKNSWTHATDTAAFAQGDVYTYPSL